jgi:hypothetical protein
MDGAVTDAATVHVAAWKTRFDDGNALTPIRDREDETWLLVKKSDVYTDAPRNLVRSEPESVVSRARWTNCRDRSYPGRGARNAARRGGP